MGRLLAKCTRMGGGGCEGVMVIRITVTETETDDIGFYGIVYRCSYCRKTDDKTDSHWVLYTCHQCQSRSRSLVD